MSLTFCASCQEVWQDSEASFCRSCGAALKQPQATETATDPPREIPEESIDAHRLAREWDAAHSRSDGGLRRDCDSLPNCVFTGSIRVNQEE